METKKQRVGVIEEPFGRYKGKEVKVFTLQSDLLRVRVLTLGAAIQSIKMNTAHGENELTLGYDRLHEYVVAKPPHYGATIGRVANRIGGGSFTLNGKQVLLDQNDSTNCLHGGYDVYDRRIFDAEIIGENSVRFSLCSPDGDQGFPGNLQMTATYTLKGGELKIDYSAKCDADTAWAPTNHAFFNFSDGAPVYDTTLAIYANAYTPVNELLLPTGECKPVSGTAFDFTTPKPIGRDIFASDPQLAIVGGGYDHNFVLQSEHAATAADKYAGVQMDVYCNTPGIQLYTGNFLEGQTSSYGIMKKHSAFCLEPQFFPNALNTPGFTSPILPKNTQKTYTFRYVFSAFSD